MKKVLTPEEIAHKYVHGEHDALTDSQEKKDMVEDIRRYAESKSKESDYLPFVSDQRELLISFAKHLQNQWVAVNAETADNMVNSFINSR